MYNICRHAHNSNARRQNIFYYDSAGTYPNVICDTNPAENLGILSDVYMISDNRRVIRISAVAADTAIAVNDTPFPDASLWVKDDGSEILQMQILTKAASTDNEA